MQDYGKRKVSLVQVIQECNSKVNEYSYYTLVGPLFMMSHKKVHSGSDSSSSMYI